MTQGCLPLQASLAVHGDHLAVAEKGEAEGPTGKKETECRHTCLGEDTPAASPFSESRWGQLRKKCEGAHHGQGQGKEQLGWLQ